MLAFIFRFIEYSIRADARSAGATLIQFHRGFTYLHFFLAFSALARCPLTPSKVLNTLNGISCRRI